jgi:hypothetical protein
LRQLPGAPIVPTMKNITPSKPAKRALAALDQTEPAVDARVRQRRISKRVNAAINLLVSGDVKTIKEAADKAGMARKSLSRALSTPHVAEHLAHQGCEVSRHGGRAPGRSKPTCSTATTRSPATVRARSGIQPTTKTSVSVNLELRAGNIIDLSEDPDDFARVTAGHS